MFSYLISLASYVLYALGLYTIANRRGIRNAWLAWVPVANMWILGSIADDFHTRQTGRRSNLRTWLIVLYIAVVVLAVLVMVCGFWALSNVLTVNELIDFYASATGMENDLYSVSQEEMIQQLTESMEARMTDEAVQNMLVASMVMLGCCLPLLIAGIALGALDLICTYRLYASCDPQNKLLYFLLGLLLGVTPVFVFLCRNKDLGMQPPPPPVMGYMPPAPDRDPWEQNEP